MLLIALMIRIGSPGKLFTSARIARGADRHDVQVQHHAGGLLRLAARELIARELRGKDTSVGGSWKIDNDRGNRSGRFCDVPASRSFADAKRVLGQMRWSGRVRAWTGKRRCFKRNLPSASTSRLASPGSRRERRSTIGRLEMLEVDLAYG